MFFSVPRVPVRAALLISMIAGLLTLHPN